MLEMTESAVELPPHVPAEFVREYPIVQGRYVEEDPYKTIIPAIHQWAPVFYATNAYPGSTPAWVLPRAAAVRPASQDTAPLDSTGAPRVSAASGERWRGCATTNNTPNNN